MVWNVIGFAIWASLTAPGLRCVRAKASATYGLREFGKARAKGAVAIKKTIESVQKSGHSGQKSRNIHDGGS
jgi:hypothetical protein